MKAAEYLITVPLVPAEIKSMIGDMSVVDRAEFFHFAHRQIAALEELARATAGA